jgi:hypothetical protein
VRVVRRRRLTLHREEIACVRTYEYCQTSGDAGWCSGRPVVARKTSIFSVNKKHKSINTKKNIAKLCSYEFTSTTAILRTTHAIGKPTTTCAYLPLSVSSVTRVAIRAMGHTHKSYGVFLWWLRLGSCQSWKSSRVSIVVSYANVV